VFPLRISPVSKARLLRDCVSGKRYGPAGLVEI
jgi:hypothetical protein